MDLETPGWSKTPNQEGLLGGKPRSSGLSDKIRSIRVNPETSGSINSTEKNRRLMTSRIQNFQAMSGTSGFWRITELRLKMRFDLDP